MEIINSRSRVKAKYVSLFLAQMSHVVTCDAVTHQVLWTVSFPSKGYSIYKYIFKKQNKKTKQKTVQQSDIKSNFLRTGTAFSICKPTAKSVKGRHRTPAVLNAVGSRTTSCERLSVVKKCISICV